MMGPLPVISEGENLQLETDSGLSVGLSYRWLMDSNRAYKTYLNTVDQGSSHLVEEASYPPVVSSRLLTEGYKRQPR
jgi:hypothetical protein